VLISSLVNLEAKHHRATVQRLARRALWSFMLTFLAARMVVFLIMSGQMPRMYFFMRGTHVHHLNYGIFLLAVVAGYSVFRRPCGPAADRTALFYGIAMGLTFDEFGMWLNLGGSYWQRASVDATIVIAALFALVGFARSLHKFEKKHFRAFLALVLALFSFGYVLMSAGNRIGDLMGPTLRDLEMSSQP
jgi:hypothetical protein